MTKPLGHRSYGSIPHLSNSKLGEEDYTCHIGQENIATKKPRDRYDLIIVQEKLDGSNCAIAKANGEILALTRSGYEAKTSPFEQHHYFDLWVYKHRKMFDMLLNEGERLVGEWMLQAHGTIYKDLKSPFFAFDLMQGKQRMIYHNFLLRVLPYYISIPKLVHIGQPVSVDYCLQKIDNNSEGLVYRIERPKLVDFLVKYVRPTKENGCYLPEKTGNKIIYNFDPELL